MVSGFCESNSSISPATSSSDAKEFANMLFWSGDVGGQRTLRPYWRNYFESTDAVVWVVDSSDRMRIGDCREELRGLLSEEVSCRFRPILFHILESTLHA